MEQAQATDGTRSVNTEEKVYPKLPEDHPCVRNFKSVQQALVELQPQQYILREILRYIGSARVFAAKMLIRDHDGEFKFVEIGEVPLMDKGCVGRMPQSTTVTRIQGEEYPGLISELLKPRITIPE